MSTYSFVAVDTHGLETRGTLDVPDQGEALRRIREMGLFPTKLLEGRERRPPPASGGRRDSVVGRRLAIEIPWLGGRIRPRALTVFTRQLATLVEAGMPLLRGLRTLEEQEGNRSLKRVIGDVAQAIEGGASLAEALQAHPKVFNRLYVNMVRAGEISGALEVTLKRLTEFMEKALKIKGKVKAALFYPCTVLTVAVAIVTLMLVFVVPRFQQVFEGLLEGRRMPAFTLFVLGISQAVKNHILAVAVGIGMIWTLFLAGLRTEWGRLAFDRFKLRIPILGKVFQKAAISRFARTLGTLVSSGVPILQALTIVKETAGNVVLGGVVSTVHERVKEGEPIAPALKQSGVFPVMVAGMVDVGEQTGALPEMLMKIADNYDDEVDNAASAMTSLLEPIMIVFLAFVVGGIVIAMFLPIIRFSDLDPLPKGGGGPAE